MKADLFARIIKPENYIQLLSGPADWCAPRAVKTQEL
jgi:hypothetical protein